MCIRDRSRTARPTLPNWLPSDWQVSMFASLVPERMTSSKSQPEREADLTPRRAKPETKRLRRLKRRKVTLKDGRYLFLYESRSSTDENA